MKKLLLIVSTILVAYGCSENKRNVYESKQSLYFAKYGVKDTIKYSFSMTNYDKDTLYIDVNLIGQLVKKETSFNIHLNSNTTAKSGVHYQELPTSIQFPAGRKNMTIPIVLLDTDEALKEKSVLLSLSIVPNAQFEIGIPEKSTLNVSISDMLVKPSYWIPNMNNAFGEYSKVKHQVCIDIMGHDFPLTVAEANSYQGNMIGISGLKYWQMTGRKVCKYFIDHPTEDENGDLIPSWEPL